MGIRLFGRSDNYPISSGRRRFSGSSDKKAKRTSGRRMLSGDSNDYSYLQPLEPHPEVFKVVELIEGSRFLYVVLNYPHCTNFEGNKVLIMKNTKAIDILHAKIIDPHFYEDNNIVARFKPDEEGKQLAKQLAGVK